MSRGEVRAPSLPGSPDLVSGERYCDERQHQERDTTEIDRVQAGKRAAHRQRIQRPNAGLVTRTAKPVEKPRSGAESNPCGGAKEEDRANEVDELRPVRHLQPCPEEPPTHVDHGPANRTTHKPERAAMRAYRRGYPIAITALRLNSIAQRPDHLITPVGTVGSVNQFTRKRGISLLAGYQRCSRLASCQGEKDQQDHDVHDTLLPANEKAGNVPAPHQASSAVARIRSEAVILDARRAILVVKRPRQRRSGNAGDQGQRDCESKSLRNHLCLPSRRGEVLWAPRTCHLTSCSVHRRRGSHDPKKIDVPSTHTGRPTFPDPAPFQEPLATAQVLFFRLEDRAALFPSPNARACARRHGV
jgi:hypothetical protein